MSLASKNLFAILGNDDDETPSPEYTVPKTKTNTSSKKGDPTPPKADPSKANPNRKKPTGNEAAFRKKDTGRDANKSKPTEEEAAPKGRKDKQQRPRDRTKTSERDSQKQINKSWGSNKTEAADEVASKDIAKYDFQTDATEDAAGGVAPEPEEDHTKTLEEYLAEMKLKSQGLNKHYTRKESDTNKWENAQEIPRKEEDIIPGKSKTLRKKNRKEKIILETEVTFERPQRRPFGASEGRRGGKPSARSRPPPRPHKISPQDFPPLSA